MAYREAAYRAEEGSALTVDKEFYDRIARAVGPDTLIDEIVIPIRDAKAWKVPAGHVFRVKTLEGPQVGDFNIWSSDDPRERMWAARTRQLQRAHVSTYDRLWSNLPFIRPMVTIIEDTLANYGVDELGGRIHDHLATRCDPYVIRL